MAGFILLLLQVAAGMGLPSSHNAGSISDWQHQSMVMPADPCYSRAVRSEPEAGKTSTPAALRHRQTSQLARLAAVVRGLCAKPLTSAGLRQHQHAILCCLAEFGPELGQAAQDRVLVLAQPGRGQGLGAEPADHCRETGELG